MCPGLPTWLPCAALRWTAGYDPDIINPLSPVDLVIDHSVMVDAFGTDQAFDQNVALEMQRNGERYRFSAGASRPSTTSGWCRPARASVIR